MQGTLVHQYKILRQLGSGGMGVVYEAEDTRLGRTVALKFLPESLQLATEAAERFDREAKLAGGLSHPNICTVHDSGVFEGRRFFVMERLEGHSLKELINGAPLPVDQILDVGCQIADALDAAHAKGIVHRDIKPGNLIVSESGTIKVLDFGLARRFKTADTDQLGPEGSTIPGRPMGTANYMAPERILQLPLDPRSDLFSLGVVMYEMATGRLPFAGASPSETVSNVLDKDPDPLSALAPQHKSLEPVIQRLLAKHARDRFESASALIAALTPLTSHRLTLWTRIARRFGRS
jgi:serine/threonine protein kinase